MIHCDHQLTMGILIFKALLGPLNVVLRYRHRYLSGSTNLKFIKRLYNEKKFRKTEQLVLVEGHRHVLEMLARNMTPKICVVSPKAFDLPLGLELKQQLRSYTEVSDIELQKITDTECSQGVVAVFRQPATDVNNPATVENLIRHVNASNSNPRSGISNPFTVLLLDHVQDPGNMGTLIRTAYGFGVSCILAVNCCEIYSPKVTRSSLALNMLTHEMPIITASIHEVAPVEDKTADKDSHTNDNHVNNERKNPPVVTYASLTNILRRVVQEQQFINHKNIHILAAVPPNYGSGSNSNSSNTNSKLINRDDINRLHAEACRNNLATYVDPATKYDVFTAIQHRNRGYCCGSYCRHCPYNYVNVSSSLLSKQIDRVGKYVMKSTALADVIHSSSQGCVPSTEHSTSIFSSSNSSSSSTQLTMQDVYMLVLGSEAHGITTTTMQWLHQLPLELKQIGQSTQEQNSSKRKNNTATALKAATRKIVRDTLPQNSYATMLHYVTIPMHLRVQHPIASLAMSSTNEAKRNPSKTALTVEGQDVNSELNSLNVASAGAILIYEMHKQLLQ